MQSGISRFIEEDFILFQIRILKAMLLLSSLMAAEVESHISLAHRELEWETEKAKVALGKLRRHFLEPLEVRKGCDQIR